MGRSYLAHRSGDANNAVLAAIGYNFRLLNWLRLLLLQSWFALSAQIYVDQSAVGV
jgi:IS5 family transposase